MLDGEIGLALSQMLLTFPSTYINSLKIMRNASGIHKPVKQKGLAGLHLPAPKLLALK